MDITGDEDDRDFSKWMRGSGRFKCNLCNFRNTERIACINHLEGMHKIRQVDKLGTDRAIGYRPSKVAIQCYLCDKYVRHEFKYLAFHFATHHSFLDVKTEYFDNFGNSAMVIEPIRPDLKDLDRGNPRNLLGFRDGGEECLRKCSLCKYLAWDPVDMSEHWDSVHDSIMGSSVDEGFADSFSVCLKGFRCKEDGCGRTLNTAEEAQYHDCEEDEDEDSDDELSFFGSEDETVMEDIEGGENGPMRARTIRVGEGMEGDSEISTTDEDEDGDEDGSEGGLIESCGVDDEEMMGFENSEDHPHIRHIDPDEDEGEWSEGIEEEEAELHENDEEELEDVGEEAVEVIDDDSGEEDDIEVIGERTIDDAEPGEIEEVAHIKHHDTEQTPWNKLHDDPLSMTKTLTEEEKLNGKPGKGKRTPKSAAKKRGPKTAEWYNGCKFYCPRDVECKYSSFPHKDSLTKHWKSWHKGTAKNLPEDPRNVITDFKCEKCTCTVPRHRVSIYSHLKSHNMSVADYEKEFNPQQKMASENQSEFHSDHGEVDKKNGGNYYEREEQLVNTGKKSKRASNSRRSRAKIPTLDVEDIGKPFVTDQEVINVEPHDDEIEKEETIESSDPDDSQPQHAADLSLSMPKFDNMSVVESNQLQRAITDSSVDFHGFNTPASVPTTPTTPTTPTALHAYAQNLDLSGETVTKMWHSASTYQCLACGEEGDYLTIDNHIRERHGIYGKLTPGLEFSGKVEYHTCLMCDEPIESDPHVINEHMNGKHRRSLAWYESRFKEMLVPIKVKVGTPREVQVVTKAEIPDYETPSKKAKMVTSTPLTAASIKPKSRLAIPNVTVEANTSKRGRKKAKNKDELAKVEYNMMDTVASELMSKLPTRNVTAESNTTKRGRENAKNKDELAKVDYNMMDTVASELMSKLPTANVTVESNTSKRGRKKAKNEAESAKVDNNDKFADIITMDPVVSKLMSKLPSPLSSLAPSPPTIELENIAHVEDNVKISDTVMDTVPIPNVAPKVVPELPPSTPTTEIKSIEHGPNRAKNKIESAEVEDNFKISDTVMDSTNIQNVASKLMSELPTPTQTTEINSMEYCQRGAKANNESDTVKDNPKNLNTVIVTDTPNMSTNPELNLNLSKSSLITTEIQCGRKKAKNKNISVKVDYSDKISDTMRDTTPIQNVATELQRGRRSLQNLRRVLNEEKSKIDTTSAKQELNSSSKSTDANEIEHDQKRAKNKNKIEKTENYLESVITDEVKRTSDGRRSRTKMHKLKVEDEGKPFMADPSSSLNFHGFNTPTSTPTTLTTSVPHNVGQLISSKLSVVSTLNAEPVAAENGHKKMEEKNALANVENNEKTKTVMDVGTPNIIANPELNSNISRSSLITTELKRGRKGTAEVVTSATPVATADSKMPAPVIEPSTVERGRKRTRKQEISTKAEGNVVDAGAPPTKGCRRTTRSTTPATTVSEEKQENAPTRRNPSRRSRSTAPVADTSSHDEDESVENEGMVDEKSEGQVDKENKDNVNENESVNVQSNAENTNTEVVTDTPNTNAKEELNSCRSKSSLISTELRRGRKGLQKKEEDGKDDDKPANKVDKRNENDAVKKIDQESKDSTVQKEVKEDPAGSKTLLDHTPIRKNDEDEDDNKPLKSRNSSKGKRSKSRKSNARRSTHEDKANEETSAEGQKEDKDKKSQVSTMPSQERTENEEEQTAGMKEQDVDKTPKVVDVSNKKKNRIEDKSVVKKEDMDRSSVRASARKRTKTMKAKVSTNMIEDDNDDDDDHEEWEDSEEEENDEDEWSLGKENQVKRKSVNRSVEATKWYDKCEFHCPKGDCGKVFTDKDFLNKHWRNTHHKKLENLNSTDFQKVVRQYECRKCHAIITWTRNFICKHVDKIHRMTLGEYEAEFHSDEAVEKEDGGDVNEYWEQRVDSGKKSNRASTGKRSRAKLTVEDEGKPFVTDLNSSVDFHGFNTPTSVPTTPTTPITPTFEKKDRDGSDEQHNDVGKKSIRASRGRRSMSKMPKADTSRQDDNGEIQADQTLGAVEKKEIDAEDEEQNGTGNNSTNISIDNGSRSSIPENGKLNSDHNTEEVGKKEDDSKEDEKQERSNDASKRSRSASGGRRSSSRRAKPDSSWQEENDYEEENMDAKLGKGKKTPRSAGKRRTPLDAWYNGCEFYCPKDEECKYDGVFPHKDSFVKHWRSKHDGSVKNLPDDPRNVIKQYHCKMCSKSIIHNRDMIYKHLRANHNMSVAEYEKQFHPK